MSASVLDLEARLELGDLELEVALRGEPGETLAILGPNGAGKTTLLRVLAGLAGLDAGRLVLGDRVLDAPDDGVFVAARDRGMGVVFQDHLLFESMSVVDNVAFGLRCRGVRRAESRRHAERVLSVVGLAGRGDDRPGALSGGQRQRVALARALVVEPQVLLLDEPLSMLDVSTRAEIRRDLRRRLDDVDVVRILVTHDPVDAYALADRVLVLEHGRVTQQGTLAEVTTRPRSGYVADLVGVNLYEGIGAGALVDVGGVSIVSGTAADGPVFVAVHPRSVSLHRTRPEGSPRNVVEGVVSDLDVEADRTRVHLDGVLGLTAEITTAAALDLGIRPGDALWASVKASEVTTYPR